MDSSLDTYITIAHYLSFFGFLTGTLLMVAAIKKFGKGTLGSIFGYLLLGTATFVAISVFLDLGAQFFGIAEDSMDVWWHVLFYMAFMFFFMGLRLFVSLGKSDAMPIEGSAIKKWGLVAIAVIAFVFLAPRGLENVVGVYTASVLDSIGLHHFIAFVFAGAVGWYLSSAKKNLGQIGRAVANPIIIAVWALSLQHLWELLNESWKVIPVTSQVGEGVEQIFLIIAAISIIWGAIKLKSFGRA